MGGTEGLTRILPLGGVYGALGVVAGALQYVPFRSLPGGAQMVGNYDTNSNEAAPLVMYGVTGGVPAPAGISNNATIDPDGNDAPSLRLSVDSSSRGYWTGQAEVDFLSPAGGRSARGWAGLPLNSTFYTHANAVRAAGTYTSDNFHNIGWKGCAINAYVSSNVAGSSLRARLFGYPSGSAHGFNGPGPLVMATGAVVPTATQGAYHLLDVYPGANPANFVSEFLPLRFAVEIVQVGANVEWFVELEAVN